MEVKRRLWRHTSLRDLVTCMALLVAAKAKEQCLSLLLDVTLSSPMPPTHDTFHQHSLLWLGLVSYWYDFLVH